MLRKLKIGLLVSGVLTILRAFGVELPGDGLITEAVNQAFPLAGFGAGWLARENRSSVQSLRFKGEP